jgi:hypothetical protein
MIRTVWLVEGTMIWACGSRSSRPDTGHPEGAAVAGPIATTATSLPDASSARVAVVTR